MSVKNLNEVLIGLELWKCKHRLKISVEENYWNAERPKYWKQMRPFLITIKKVVVEFLENLLKTSVSGNRVSGILASVLQKLKLSADDSFFWHLRGSTQHWVTEYANWGVRSWRAIKYRLKNRNKEQTIHNFDNPEAAHNSGARRAITRDQEMHQFRGHLFASFYKEKELVFTFNAYRSVTQNQLIAIRCLSFSFTLDLFMLSIWVSMWVSMHSVRCSQSSFQALRTHPQGCQGCQKIKNFMPNQILAVWSANFQSKLKKRKKREKWPKNPLFLTIFWKFS